MRLVTLGFDCNNACLFCAQGSLRTTTAHRSAEAIEAIEAIEAGVEGIGPGEDVALVGGEPTLFEGLLGWVEAVARRGPRRVVLQTNGRRLAYRAYVAELAKRSPGLEIEVALQGSTSVMHDFHTGVAGSFAQTVAGIRNARAEGLGVATTTVLTRANYRHLTEILRVGKALGARAAYLARAERLGRASRSSTAAVPLELVSPYLERAAREAARAGLPLAIDARGARALGFVGIGITDPATYPARAEGGRPAE